MFHLFTGGAASVAQRTRGSACGIPAFRLKSSLLAVFPLPHFPSWSEDQPDRETGLDAAWPSAMYQKPTHPAGYQTAKLQQQFLFTCAALAQRGR